MSNETMMICTLFSCQQFFNFLLKMYIKWGHVLWLHDYDQKVMEQVLIMLN